MNAITIQPETRPADDLRIRICVPDDLDELMALSMSACEENGFLNPDPAKLVQALYPALLQDHGIIGGIGRAGGIIEGAVLLHIGQLWYSNDYVVEEKAIFIHPDYRTAKGGRARRLCEFSKQVADSLAEPLLIGILSNARTEGKIRMYRRVFGEPSGAWFLYGAQTGHWNAAN